MKFHFRWGTKPRNRKQETGNDCDVISGHQVSPVTCPYMCGSNCVLKWYKSAKFMGLVIRKTRKEAFVSIRYHFSVIKGLKPRKEGESGLPW